MNIDRNYIRQRIEASIAIKQEVLKDEELMDRLLALSNECVAAFNRGNKVILAGNGGSAADAQHIAAEFVSRFEFDRPGLPSIAITTDTSMITAIGNDYGYDRVFTRQLEAISKPGDVFIGITTSGNSVNVVHALERAKSLELVTATFTGLSGKVHELAEYVIAVPSKHTARIQECHILVGHILCGIVEDSLFERPAQ